MERPLWLQVMAVVGMLGLHLVSRVERWGCLGLVEGLKRRLHGLVLRVWLTRLLLCEERLGAWVLAGLI